MDDSVAIVIAPGSGGTDELAQQAATVLGRGLYQTRRLLASKFPRLAARHVEPRQAEATIRQLEDLGVLCFTWLDQELFKPLDLFTAKTLAFTADAIVFKDKKAGTVRLASSDAVLIIKGIRKNTLRQEVVRKSKRLNLMGTLLTGGIPIRKTVEEKTFETTTRDERIVRLFGKTADSGVEIPQTGFDYACLGPDMTPSSLRNIDLLAGTIKNFFPAAAYDDNLGTPSRTTGISASGHENIDVACKLLYRWYQEKKPVGPD